MGTYDCSAVRLFMIVVFVASSSCCQAGAILFLQLSQCFFQNWEPLFVFGVS